MKPIVFIFISILASSSCHDANQDTRDKILHDFDSVNQSLDKTNRIVNESEGRLYDSLLEKLSKEDFSGMRQFYYTVHDFYGYLQNLRWSFYRYCGDTLGTGFPNGRDDDLKLTNGFIKDPKQTIQLLHSQLENVVQTMQQYNKSDSLNALLQSFRVHTLQRFPTPERFLDAWFKNMPPVAVITILNSFELDVKNIEAHILKDHYKNSK